ncbi:hypothetical protein FQZ97_876090 [compost metagenome]
MDHAGNGFVHVVVEGRDLVSDGVDHPLGEAPFARQFRAHLGIAVAEQALFSAGALEVEHGDATVQVHHGLGHAGVHHQFADAVEQARGKGGVLVDPDRQRDVA